MPFNELQRRDSWPPTQIRIRDEESEDLDAIDENPFSFFLTSPDDLDDDGEDLSAGIESSVSKPRVREVSPSDIQRSPLPLDDDDEDDDFDLVIPLSLREFSGRYTSDGRRSRAGKRPEDALKGLGITLPDFNARGRSTVRLVPSRPSRSGRGRGQTRSLSARRPHSWRLPSPELGSIKEERESDEEREIQNNIKRMQEMSVSAPATSYMERAAPSPKPKKKVHWAF
jgi:hypothetical protein